MAIEPNEAKLSATINTVVFDIVGTLLDNTGTIQQEVKEIFAAHGKSETAAETFASKWSEKQVAIVDAIVKEERPWLIESETYREALQVLLTETDLDLSDAEFKRLATIEARFQAFPDAARQLDGLSSIVKTAGLTNAGFVPIIESNTASGLRWHALLSGQFVRAYKPQAAVYNLAIHLLEINPAKTLFIAAHPWDLRAAATHGFRTAYLPRPHADKPNADDHFDVTLDSLDELIEMLGAGR